MHGAIGLHSALAIKRQRRLREQAKRRSAKRRLSAFTNSVDSLDSPNGATKSGEASGGAHQHRQDFAANNGLASSIGMLHIGVCFFVLGLFLIGSGIMSDGLLTSAPTGSWWSELIATGIFVIVLGVTLICLNSFMGKKEDQQLSEYVQRQLTRSRSGHRLEVDVETGCLTRRSHSMEPNQQQHTLSVQQPPMEMVHSASASSMQTLNHHHQQPHNKYSFNGGSKNDHHHQPGQSSSVHRTSSEGDHHHQSKYPVKTHIYGQKYSRRSESDTA